MIGLTVFGSSAQPWTPIIPGPRTALSSEPIGLPGGGGGASPFMNTSATHIWPPPYATPTPTHWKLLSIMLAKCAGELMNAAWSDGTLGPCPTFSPSLRHPTLTPSVRLEWQRQLVAAMCAAQACAFAVSTECTASGPAPWLARVELIAETNWPSAAGSAAWASSRLVTTTNPARATIMIAANRRRMLKSPLVADGAG